MGVPNAFAVGRKGNGTIVLSYALLDTLDSDQIEAVLAHELSHLRSHDTTVMTVGYSIVTIIHLAAVSVTNDAEGVPGLLFGSLLIFASGVVRVAVLIPLRGVSRYREYIADWDAARFTDDPEALASGLERIQQHSRRSAPTEHAAEINELCIIHLKDTIVDRLFGSHPPVDDRVDRLRDYSDD